MASTILKKAVDSAHAIDLYFILFVPTVNCTQLNKARAHIEVKKLCLHGIFFNKITPVFLLINPASLSYAHANCFKIPCWNGLLQYRKNILWSILLFTKVINS